MHVLRPLYVFLALAAVIFLAGTAVVPRDFGIHERGYMYGWFREGNIQDWKNVQPKYRGRDDCRDCHAGAAQEVQSSPHKIIECEDCHGPAREHPSEPPKLSIDRSRALCLRCHAYLAYPTSQRSQIKGIDPEEHNPGAECAGCHNPHQAMKPEQEEH